MQLSRLKPMAVFAAVVKTGNFSRAGKLLGISRPAVSAQIQKLEESLSVRLIQRTTRSVSLTQDGARLLPLAESVLSSLIDIDDVLTRDKPKGPIRVTATLDIMKSWLAPKLEAFTLQYPDITFDLVMTDQKIDLIENQIDLAIRVSRVNEQDFVARPVFDDQLAIYASPEYLDTLLEPITEQNLEFCRWIVLEQLMPNRTVTVMKGDETLRFQPSRYDIVNSPSMLNELVVAGRGLGCLIYQNVQHLLKEGKLVPVLPEWHGDSLTCYLLYPSRQHIPMRLRLFIDYLLESRDKI
ncbi:LysR family transcriptional regulator [Enterovibrio norvegicus]|uniref:DNA-binding transcriptional regulator, LysR family n=1 Tax=Enterovibrio norvegicus DSM 15893 TaxID=1121869 RepID=A0A1I5SW19_9GAMM|nr:LysR family transcriptional regulator [Enterovibrio norvegicus]SFP74972.1 DNA-binding transcriptional regulator, LysR family [Enterovibrio norvegicus DSM 15893]